MLKSITAAGADELLGGYSRHRTARVKRGAEGTRDEMLKDCSPWSISKQVIVGLNAQYYSLGYRLAYGNTKSLFLQ